MKLIRFKEESDVSLNFMFPLQHCQRRQDNHGQTHVTHAIMTAGEVNMIIY